MSSSAHSAARKPARHHSAPMFDHSKNGYGDIEAGFVPPEYRWKFVQKVYGILSSQIILTMLTVAFVVFTESFKAFILSSPWIILVFAILPIVIICVLFPLRQNHPINLVLLGLFTVSTSTTVGMACAFSPGIIVLEALLLTSIVVASLTAYSFWAIKRGHDFSFLGPMLFVSLMILVTWGFIQLFFPFGKVSDTIYSLFGSILFSIYIVYDTDNLIKRHSIDDYVWASISLYLDIINLFLFILRLLNSNRD